MCLRYKSKQAVTTEVKWEESDLEKQKKEGNASQQEIT